MNINDIIAEALSIVNHDNSPVGGNSKFLKSQLPKSDNKLHGTNNLNWKFNDAPPSAKVQEKRMSKLNGIVSNKTQ